MLGQQTRYLSVLPVCYSADVLMWPDQQVVVFAYVCPHSYH